MGGDTDRDESVTRPRRAGIDNASPPAGDVRVHGLFTLQQSAGNRAVISLLAGSAGARGERSASNPREPRTRPGQLDDDQEELEGADELAGQAAHVDAGRQGEHDQARPAGGPRHESGAHAAVAPSPVGPEGGLVPERVAATIRSRQGHGESLSEPLRREVGGLLGAPLGDVGIHHDERADALSRQLGATAFTVGHDVFFSAGAYQPETAAGRALIAHELAHVVQNQGAPPSEALTVGPVDDPHEHQADEVATAALAVAQLGLGAALEDGRDAAVPSYLSTVVSGGPAQVHLFRGDLAQFAGRQADPLEVTPGKVGEHDSAQVRRTTLEQIRRLGRAPSVPAVAAPSVDTIKADPTVVAALNTAFTDSNPHAPDCPPAPTTTKQEQGGWIIWNSSTGAYRIVRVPAGTRDGLGTIVGTKPSPAAPEAVVAWFHTHPNTAAEGYDDPPSGADRTYTRDSAKVPGIVKGHLGVYTIPYP